jgi:hypothetical protein
MLALRTLVCQTVHYQAAAIWVEWGRMVVSGALCGKAFALIFCGEVCYSLRVNDATSPRVADAFSPHGSRFPKSLHRERSKALPRLYGWLTPCPNSLVSRYPVTHHRSIPVSEPEGSRPCERPSSRSPNLSYSYSAPAVLVLALDFAAIIIRVLPNRFGRAYVCSCTPNCSFAFFPWCR